MAEKRSKPLGILRSLERNQVGSESDVTIHFCAPETQYRLPQNFLQPQCLKQSS